MALTVTANTMKNFTSPSTAFAAGEIMNWRVDVTSTTSLFGKQIGINPAFWQNKNQFVTDATEFLNDGFFVTLPLIIGRGSMAWLSGSTSINQKNYECEFNLTSATTIEFTLTFLNTIDLNDFTADFLNLNNVDRLRKSSVQNFTVNNNSVPSVYNTDKVARMQIMVGDALLNIVEQQIYVDFEMSARFYQLGLYNGVAEFTNWSYEFERNGEIVTDLSHYDNTILRVYVDIGAGTISATTQLNVFRVDSVRNITDYITDAEMGVHLNAASVAGLDYVVNYTPWALVAGTQYMAEWELDASMLQNGGQYLFGVVVRNAGLTIANSFITTRTTEPIAPPSPTTGTMTGELFDYNDLYTGNCLQATSYERIKSCVNVDKSSYDADLLGASLPGSFDDNLQSVRVRIYSAFGNVTLFDVNTDNNADGELEIIDTADDYKSCVTFRIHPEYANMPFSIEHIYTYLIPLADYPYTDVVTFRQLVNVEQPEELDTVSPAIIRMDLFDAANNPVFEICETFDAPLRVEVEKVATVGDYNLIAMIKKDVPLLAPNEQEDYALGILPQLNTDEIIAVDTLFVANIASFTINPFELEKGTQYRVIAVMKPENLTPPVICDVITLNIVAIVVAITPGSPYLATVNIEYTVSDYAPAVVTAVDVRTKTVQSGAGANQSNNFVVDNNNYNYAINWTPTFTGSPITIQATFVITLNNGCEYYYTAEFDVMPLAGMNVPITTTLSAN